MKSKPKVMEHFSTVHTSYILNFDFTNNITILTGSSATGKTNIIFIYERVYGSKSQYSVYKLSGLSERHKKDDC